jgi:hypothetical protein
MKRVGTTIAHWSGTDKGSGATPASNAQGMPASITTPATGTATGFATNDTIDTRRKTNNATGIVPI